MRNDNLQISAFYPLWKKYKPVVLKLMVDAENGPQSYPLSKHEFTDLAPKKNIVYSFKIDIFQSKPLVAIKTSLVAQDFMEMIKQSGKAIELMDVATYHIELDKQFMLNISCTPVANETEEAPEEEAEKETEE
ncbi:hypothetical protein BFP97_04730 [Roseivirga sp. 4D4]|uniref:hypothetical protein n=1 Tax=Roseivirga sp. 4D4 TaxID=1889784 RepID=UPI000853DE1C|nr:hypothetical protein [Roseivirga sp. 4D4]OEK00855.1 hypothetical protein BFP97_04730 [Roseivirga sp. 4D4]